MVIDEENRRASSDRCFWLLALGVVLASILTQIFDFSVIPPAYRGLFLTRPFCGLHSWASAKEAWAARSHVKYGLGYTKGYRTLVVGNPPPAHPLRYVSHPSLETLIAALGMLLLGTEEWQIRLFDLILSVSILLLMMLLLRRLYGGACAIISGLIYAVLPISAYFGYGGLMALLSLWALYRYLGLTGRLSHETKSKGRHLLELALALFLMIQLAWVGVFYAAILVLHYGLRSLFHLKVQGKVATVLILAPLLSLALNLHAMVNGYRNNIEAQAAASAKTGSGVGSQDTPWGLIETLYRFASEGERGSSEWGAWPTIQVEYLVTNFTAPGVAVVVMYLLYLGMMYIFVGFKRMTCPDCSMTIPWSFGHMWFFLLPGLMFLFTFKGLVWEHQYWQYPLTLFVAIGTAMGVLLAKDLVGRVLGQWVGRFAVVVSILMLVVFCNQGLTAYRAIRWQSPRTIELFKRLHRHIPPDKALLTFKDFMVRQNKAKTSFYRPEYAWYLDREMVVANAWYPDPNWARLVQVGEVVRKTLREVQRQTETGRFAYYYIPACEDPQKNPSVQHQPGEILLEGMMSMPDPGLWDHLKNKDKRTRIPPHSPYWEQHRLYREALIARLQKLYPYEYVENPGKLGDEDYCPWGVTPCYLFDLTHPRQ